MGGVWGSLDICILTSTCKGFHVLRSVGTAGGHPEEVGRRAVAGQPAGLECSFGRMVLGGGTKGGVS